MYLGSVLVLGLYPPLVGVFDVETVVLRAAPVLTPLFGVLGATVAEGMEEAIMGNVRAPAADLHAFVAALDVERPLSFLGTVTGFGFGC